MKLAIFSDIHGNTYAFKKMFRLLLKEKCDFHIFLGDVCGYYCYNDDIIDFLRLNQNSIISILGNHDKIFLDILTNKEIEEKYIQQFGYSSLYLKKNIKKENIRFLKTLPSSYFNDSFNLAFFHGSPWNHLDGYVYHNTSLAPFKKLNFNYVFLGHTHYSMKVRYRGAIILNPGSVGQPRDGIRPSFAIYDTIRNTVKIKKFEYDVEALIKEIKKRREKNSYLIEVLKRGKN